MIVRPVTFPSIDDLHEALRGKRYFASRGLTTTIFLALRLGRPLFLEGEAGVGKTEVAKVLADLLDTELIRLQCYEGLDVHHAVYEWNYTRQMIHIRLLEARGGAASEAELFGPDGDPSVLRDEIARLQRSSRRLIWLNPLLGSPEYEPLMRGIQTALPYIDDFMPVHNLASLEELAEHLGGLSERRPRRKQQVSAR